MKVMQLAKNRDIYTCNSYLLMGDCNRLDDVNTLIDPGVDGSVIEQIEQLSTGCGKKAVEQVILTHEHFDHAAGAVEIKKNYNCPILAFKPGKGVDKLLRDGEKIIVADRTLEVIHAPFHSNDSTCLYCAEEGLLFSGDTPLRILMDRGSYSREFVNFLSRLDNLKLETVYSGHDEPLTEGVAKVVRRSLARVLANVTMSRAEEQRMSA